MTHHICAPYSPRMHRLSVRRKDDEHGSTRVSFATSPSRRVARHHGATAEWMRSALAGEAIRSGERSDAQDGLVYGWWQGYYDARPCPMRRHLVHAVGGAGL